MSGTSAPRATRPWPARLPLYYGWVMLAVAAMAMTATLPGRTHGLGLITKPLSEDLGISEVRFGVINFWSILLGAAFCLPVGRLIDRYGSRLTMTLVTAGLGIVVILTGRVESTAALFLLLTLTRGLGQGALSVLSTTLVGKWFTRRLALAMGIFAVLLALGFMGSVLGMGAAIKAVGWRAAWGQMGWLILLVAAPLSLLLTRSTPESIGLQTDEAVPKSEPADPRIDLTLREAIASPAFWAFSAAMVVHVPLVSQPIAELQAAGFGGLQITRYSEKPWFRHEGVELREVKIIAWQPSASNEQRRVLYKGPFAEATDDRGTVYPRGQRVAVSHLTWDQLRRGAAADNFLFLDLPQAESCTA